MKKSFKDKLIDRIIIPSMIVLPFLISPVPGFFQPAIKPEDIETVLKEEKQKLDIKDKITVSYGKATMRFDALAQIEPTADESGEITSYHITLDELKSRFIVRHELYHLKDGHLLRAPTLVSIIKDDVEANFYALTGIRF